MSEDFIAVDWGTSSFRLWLMDRGGQIHGESRSSEGMQHCAEAGFAPVLAKHLTEVGAKGQPVLICGMAGARQGWFEAPYADLPAPVSVLAGHAATLPADLLGPLAGRDIRILPGVARRHPNRPDVMRGEETQLLGLALDGAAGLICMPGTHCKWARLADGAVTDFQSYMTGELFALLSWHSILRHAMPENGMTQPDDPAFTDALDEVLDDPAFAFDALFPLRAGDLLGTQDKAASFARLSGLLIGAEVARQIDREAPENVILVGQVGLGPLYAAALKRLGVEISYADAEQATRQGLLAAANEIWGWA